MFGWVLPDVVSRAFHAKSVATSISGTTAIFQGKLYLEVVALHPSGFLSIVGAIYDRFLVYSGELKFICDVLANLRHALPRGKNQGNKR